MKNLSSIYRIDLNSFVPLVSAVISCFTFQSRRIYANSFLLIYLDVDDFPLHDLSMNKFLFNKPMPCLHTVCIEIPDGLKLSKSLTSHQILRNVNLILQTIDDLYVLLDGLVPNVQKMIIQLCQSRLLSM